MPRIDSLVLLSLGVGCGLAPCQSPAKSPAADCVTVQLVCEAAGTPSPRLNGADLPAELARARRWVDRKVTWRVGDRPVGTAEALATELQRVRNDQSGWRDSPDQPGIREPLPVRLVPGEGVRWSDVLHLTDAAHRAGFAEVGWDGVTTRYLVAKSVTEQVLGGGVLVVPQCDYHEPDEQPPDWRPILDLHQDGRIAHGGVTVLEPVAGKPADLEPVRALLRQLRATAKEKGLISVSGRDRQEVIDAPLMIRADKWTPWTEVRNLAQLATDPAIGFWKLEFGVSDFDMEARLRDRRP